MYKAPNDIMYGRRSDTARAGLLMTGRGRIHDACGDNRPRGLNSFLFLLHFPPLLFPRPSLFRSLLLLLLRLPVGRSVARSVVRSLGRSLGRSISPSAESCGTVILQRIRATWTEIQRSLKWNAKLMNIDTWRRDFP